MLPAPNVCPFALALIGKRPPIVGRRADFGVDFKESRKREDIASQLHVKRLGKSFAYFMDGLTGQLSLIQTAGCHDSRNPTRSCYGNMSGGVCSHARTILPLITGKNTGNHGALEV